LKNYGTDWAVYPVPVILKNYIRVPIKLFGLPYDINNLSASFLAKIAVRGLPLVIGSETSFALIILDQDTVKSVFIFDLNRGGIHRIKSVSPTELEECFRGLESDYNDTASRLEEAKFILWEKYGWVSFAFGMQQDFFMQLVRTFRPGFTSSILQIPKMWWRLKKIKKAVKSGGFAAYPDLQFRRAGEWVQRQGFWGIYQALLKAPFERKRPKTRGLLYIRESIIAAVVLILILILLILIL